jgi:prophage regulatory protein
MQRMLRLPDVMSITGLAASTIYKHISLNQFPKAVPLAPGCRAVGWLENEIAAHQKRCAAQRNGKTKSKTKRRA